jgi:hypothetical protein
MDRSSHFELLVVDALNLRRVCVVLCKYCKKKRSIVGFLRVFVFRYDNRFTKFPPHVLSFPNCAPLSFFPLILPDTSCEYIGQGISLGAWGVKLYYLIMPRTATLTLPKEITGAKGVLDLRWRVQKRWVFWVRKVGSACVSLLFLSLTRTSCLAGGYTSDVLQNYWRGGTRSRGSFPSSIENWVDRPLNLTCWRKQSSLLHFNWLAQLWSPFV